MSPADSGVLTASAPFVAIEHVSKKFDHAIAVDDISLEIVQGEIFALLGPSGCGKSTLLRMLAGFETPSAGRILLAGNDITTLPPYERPINMMFQSYALFPHLNVWENVAFGLKRQGMPSDKVAQRVTEMLAMVQLASFAKRKPHQLSGGQQQRVALARSLALEPQLLLLDEPLGALDRKLRGETQFELKNILKKVGVTCIIVTHDQEEAMMMADRIAVLSAGRILQIGAAQDIYETPNCRFVADFIGTVNLFEGTLAEDEPDHCIIDTRQGRFLVGHGISGTLGMALALAIRPEKITLTTEPTLDGETNAFAGTVIDCTYFGSASIYRVALTSGAIVRVAQTNNERHVALLQTGATVTIRCASDAIVVLNS